MNKKGSFITGLIALIITIVVLVNFGVIILLGITSESNGYWPFHLFGIVVCYFIIQFDTPLGLLFSIISFGLSFQKNTYRQLFCRILSGCTALITAGIFCWEIITYYT